MSEKAQLFFAAAQLKTVDFELPGLGVVQVSELSEASVSEIRAIADALTDENQKRNAMTEGMIVRSILQDGAPVFTDDDAKNLHTAIGNALFQTIAEKVFSVNGFGTGN